MFKQSYTGHLISFLCAYIKNSFFVSLVIKFCSKLKNDFLTSRLVKVLSAIVSFIQKQYDVSLLKGFANSRNRIHEAYTNSMLCGLVCSVFSLMTKICGSTYNFFEKLARGGITHSIGSYFANKKLFAFHSLFALAVALMMICPHEYWNNLYACVLAFGFGAWLLVRIHNKKETADFKNINFGLVLFILFAVLASALSFAQKDALRILLFVICAVIFGLIMGKAANTENKLLYILKILCSGVAITSVIGIVQRIMGIEVNPEYVDVATSANMPGRVFSTFANPNNFAELLVLFMPLTLALVLTLKGNREKLFFAVCFALDITALGMSYSRSCWVALALSLVVMLLVYDWKLLIPIAFLALIAIPFLPSSIINRMGSTGSMDDSSNAYRLYIWSGAGKTLKNFFLSGLGAGPGNFTAYYRPLAEFRAITAPHSHMIYMELVIEFGIFGALGFFGYFASVIKKGFSSVKNSTKATKAVIGATIGSMVGMLFVCMAEYVWFYPRDMFMFWIVLGIITGACSASKNKIN